MNVIDSSIALQWVLPEAGAAEAVTDAPFRKRVEDRGYGHLLGEAV
ncbi:MAG: hypothetical protein Q7T08_14480 [Devosia sp.]|nr:hypothetical protein [Devosia sp.]